MRLQNGTNQLGDGAALLRCSGRGQRCATGSLLVPPAAVSQAAPSVRLDLRPRDHRLPALPLGLDELGELGRRAADRDRGVRLAELIADLIGGVIGEGPAAAQVLAELKATAPTWRSARPTTLHTGAAASLALHPIHALWRAGLSLSFHSDNRLMSRVDHSTEAARLVAAGFGWGELVQMGLDAAQASFLPEATRQVAMAALRRWAAVEGPAAATRH